MKLFFMGKQRAGKDTAADYLVSTYGFEKFSLSTGVYEVAEKYFGMAYKHRELLINIAESLRAIDPLVWCKYTLKLIADYVEAVQSHSNVVETNIIIPDVRMQHEYEFLKSQGFIPVGIYASLETRRARIGYNKKFENHPTEPEIFDYDFFTVIDNNNALPDLFEHLDNLMLQLGRD